MNILIVSQYFWPENFRINDLVAELVKKGHQVTVLTGLPNYPDGTIFPAYQKNPGGFTTYSGATIFRVWHILRGQSTWQLVCNYVSFFVSAALLGAVKLRHTPVDVIFVFAVSPISVAIPAIYLGRKKRAPIFLWVQDLWPETLVALKRMHAKPILNGLAKVVRWIYDHCDMILIQSRAFKSSVVKHSNHPLLAREKIRYFPNWAERLFSECRPIATISALPIKRDPSFFTIVFAGNIGDAQDFPTILEAATQLKEHVSIRWIIVGKGRLYNWVEKEVARRGLGEKMKLMGHFPTERMPDFFDVADVLLVSLQAADIFALTIPAKIQSYLAAAKPILGVLNGEAKTILEESRAAYVCDAGDVKHLVNNILAMSQLTSESLAEMGQHGRKYYEMHFDREKLIAQLEAWFEEACLKRL